MATILTPQHDTSDLTPSQSQSNQHPTSTLPSSSKGAKKPDLPMVTDPPKYDLSTYLRSYSGRTLLTRTWHISKCCPPLAIEALTRLIQFSKLFKDTTYFQLGLDELSKLDPTAASQISSSNSTWLVDTKKENQLRLANLEGELKLYKNNLIKESIRMGYDDLGKHAYHTGDLPAALEAFTSEREVCLDPTHIAIMQFRLLLVQIELEAWPTVVTLSNRIIDLSHTPSPSTSRQSKAWAAKAHAALGLAKLRQGRYKECAQSLLEVDFTCLAPSDSISQEQNRDDHRAHGDELLSYITTQERLRPAGPGGSDGFTEVLSPNDIAVYGALSALASFSRAELKSKVLESGDTSTTTTTTSTSTTKHSSFRTFLELEPHLRRAISNFINGKFASTLAILQSYRADYICDVHLARHFDDLVLQIRNRALTGYVLPFSCVTLGQVGSVFNMDEMETRKTLVGLIEKGELKTRIDVVKGYVVREEGDEEDVLGKAVSVAERHVRDVSRNLFRVEMVVGEVEVKSGKEKEKEKEREREVIALD